VLLVRAIRKDAEDSPASGEPHDLTGRAHQQRRIVARIRAREHVPAAIEAQVARRDEAATHHVAAQQTVHPGADLARRGGAFGERAHGRLQIRHQQRGGQALARHIRDQQAEHVVVERECVVAVAAVATRGPPRGGNAVRADARQRGRQQAPLDGARIRLLALMPEVLLARHAAVGDLAGEDFQQRRVVPRFLDEAARPSPHRLDGRVDCSPPGHDDHGQQRVEAARAGHQLEPLAGRRGVSRVVEVGQQQLVRPLLQVIERGDGRGDEVGVEVRSFQEEPQRFEYIGLIVGHKDTRTHDRSLDNQRASCERPSARQTAVEPSRDSRIRDHRVRIRDARGPARTCATAVPRPSRRW
jgi:hypothetical protein